MARNSRRARVVEGRRGSGVAKKPFMVAGTVRSDRFEGRSGSERSTERGSSAKPLHRGHALTTLSLPGRSKRKSWLNRRRADLYFGEVDFREWRRTLSLGR